MTSAVTCAKCASDDLLVVRLSPKDTEMVFHTCRGCEHTWWEDVDDGADIDLTDVLDIIAS